MGYGRLTQNPNPKSPIPNPQSPIFGLIKVTKKKNYLKKLNLN